VRSYDGCVCRRRAGAFSDSVSLCVREREREKERERERKRERERGREFPYGPLLRVPVGTGSAHHSKTGRAECVLAAVYLTSISMWTYIL